jgi:methionine-rich copper-binding protein CopC
MLMKRLILGLIAVVAALLTLPAPAYAHNSLVEALPAKEAVLTEAPAEVRLRFLSALKPTTKLTVTGPGGTSVIGPATVDGKFIFAPFTGKANGVYTVGYDLVSDDGHPIVSTFTFTLQGQTEPAVVTQSATPTAKPEPTGSPIQAETTPKSQETPWLPWIGGSIVAGLLAGGVITFLRNRRKSA